MTPLAFSRGQMVREATLTEADLAEVDKCRRDHNRLAFAYQIGFVRLFSRFPAQQPLEICDELLHFVSLQVGIDEARIADYAPWQHTTSEHQGRIRDYLKLAVFDAEQAEALERFVFEESCRLEQTAALLARAREFLKERRVLFPAESVLLRLVGEQKKRAREHIVAQLAGVLSPGVIKALDGLLEVKEGEAVSGLQGIKTNPAKPSATVMQGLADKLAAIEATGTLAIDLSWLNANYPMFGVARRNPLRCKGRIFDSSLHHGFFPLGWRGRALVDELQRLQDQPRVGTAAGHPTTFRLSLQAEGHQPNRRQRVHRPRRRQINTRLFESSAEKSLDQQGQRRDKNVRLDSRLDLVIDRPHRHYVLQLPKSALDVGQFLVHATASRTLSPFSLVATTYFPSSRFSRSKCVWLSVNSSAPPVSFQSKYR